MNNQKVVSSQIICVVWLCVLLGSEEQALCDNPDGVKEQPRLASNPIIF